MKHYFAAIKLSNLDRQWKSFFINKPLQIQNTHKIIFKYICFHLHIYHIKIILESKNKKALSEKFIQIIELTYIQFSHTLSKRTYYNVKKPRKIRETQKTKPILKEDIRFRMAGDFGPGNGNLQLLLMWTPSFRL